MPQPQQPPKGLQLWPPAGLDPLTLQLPPELNSRYWEGSDTRERRAADTLSSGITAFVLIGFFCIVAAVDDAGAFGAAGLSCLYGLVLETTQLACILRRPQFYAKHRDAIQTAQRALELLGGMYTFWTGPRRRANHDIAVRTYRDPYKLLANAMLQAPALWLLTSLAHPAPWLRGELPLCAVRILAYTALEAQVWGCVAETGAAQWFTAWACRAGAAFADAFWPLAGAWPPRLQGVCVPGQAGKFTTTLAMVLCGTYAPLGLSYLGERRRKLRWLAAQGLGPGPGRGHAWQPGASIVPAWVRVPTFGLLLASVAVVLSFLAASSAGRELC
jgi:hypothetical protein